MLQKPQKKNSGCFNVFLMFFHQNHQVQSNHADRPESSKPNEAQQLPEPDQNSAGFIEFIHKLNQQHRN